MVTIGPLDKTGPSTRFYVTADVETQFGNTSRIRVHAITYNGPSGNTSSFFGGAGSQIGSIDGVGNVVVHSAGSNFLPSGYAQNQLRWDDSGYVDLVHDSEGYLGPLTIRMTVTYGSINEAYTGTLYIARIPKPPSQMSAPGISELAPTGAKVTWTPPSDNRGASIDQYLLRINTVTPADSGGYVDYPVDAATVSKVLTGLTPGVQYYAAVYAHNSAGYSAKSTDAPFKTLSGMYVWNGTEWRGSEVKARNSTNTADVTGEVWVRNAANTAWVLAS